jgi:hypothetical protein
MAADLISNQKRPERGEGADCQQGEAGRSQNPIRVHLFRGRWVGIP